jgi:hypothetical protein
MFFLSAPLPKEKERSLRRLLYPPIILQKHISWDLCLFFLSPPDSMLLFSNTKVMTPKTKM